MVLFEQSEFTILADEARNSLNVSPLGAFGAPPLLCVQMGWQKISSKHRYFLVRYPPPRSFFYYQQLNL